MSLLLPWLLLLCFLVLFCLDTAFGLQSYPLPVFTRVEMKRVAEISSTSITVHYRSNAQPFCEWLVNDVPFVGGREDNFELSTHFEGSVEASGRATITVPYSVGTRFSVCLQTLGARNCLQLHPIASYLTQDNTDVDLPWPFLLPVSIHFNQAPIAQYESGQKTQIFSFKMDTWTYTHSGRFVFLEPGQANRSLPQTGLREAESIGGVQGGQAGGIVTVEPVASGRMGWMMEVATDEVGYEGVLYHQTTIAPIPSPVVEKSVTIRTINIFNRRHLAPFPNNFVAMLPHRGADNFPVTCRSQGNWTCLLVCPFVISGNLSNIELNLSRIYSNGRRIVYLQQPTTSAEIRRTGEYLAEARFLLEEGEEKAEAGIYRCSVTLNGYRTLTFANVTLV